MHDFLKTYSVVYIDLLDDKLQAFREAAEAILPFEEEVVEVFAKLALPAGIFRIFWRQSFIEPFFKGFPWIRNVEPVHSFHLFIQLFRNSHRIYDLRLLQTLRDVVDFILDHPCNEGHWTNQLFSLFICDIFQRLKSLLYRLPI